MFPGIEKTLLFRQNKNGEAALQNFLTDQERVGTGFRSCFSAGNFLESVLVDQLITKSVQITDTPLNMMDVTRHLETFTFYFKQLKSNYYLHDLQTKLGPCRKKSIHNMRVVNFGNLKSRKCVFLIRPSSENAE